MRVETEEKYYCQKPENLIKIAKELNFKETEKEEEIDEYFTDINSNFIKNRTCLRIRKTNNKTMEITYKGKSDSLFGLFCKLENNVKANIEDYDNYVSLLSSLGYYSYVEVVKNRLTYEMKNKNYKYSIMIDTLPEIGGFAEFEILSKRNENTKEELKKELSNFVSKFSELKLNEAKRPYRDIVAGHIKQKLTKNKEILNLCINLDGELSRYEKIFFKKYQDQISKICGKPIKWREYKDNESIDKKLYPLVEEYLESLIFDSQGLLITSKLLKQLPYTKYYFTKVNESFCQSFLKKLNIENNNVLYIKNNETISNILKQNNIQVKNSVIIDEKDFKITNSKLLILINE